MGLYAVVRNCGDLFLPSIGVSNQRTVSAKLAASQPMAARFKTLFSRISTSAYCVRLRQPVRCPDYHRSDVTPPRRQVTRSCSLTAKNSNTPRGGAVSPIQNGRRRNWPPRVVITITNGARLAAMSTLRSGTICVVFRRYSAVAQRLQPIVSGSLADIRNTCCEIQPVPAKT